ncbi:hypothetical protein IF1G_10426 [Cordyceps javanica]|uniref:Uncharacterized protein n=1 Tax=Cordyceps javanica TaxID=43265 RepID=A0A545UN63_9HYPO|nr:hypothetical protein IF1G_10426 [Cordyceps javanica]
MNHDSNEGNRGRAFSEYVGDPVAYIKTTSIQPQNSSLAGTQPTPIPSPTRQKLPRHQAPWLHECMTNIQTRNKLSAIPLAWEPINCRLHHTRHVLFCCRPTTCPLVLLSWCPGVLVPCCPAVLQAAVSLLSPLLPLCWSL